MRTIKNIAALVLLELIFGLLDLREELCRHLQARMVFVDGGGRIALHNVACDSLLSQLATVVPDYAAFERLFLLVWGLLLAGGLKFVVSC